VLSPWTQFRIWLWAAVLPVNCVPLSVACHFHTATANSATLRNLCSYEISHTWLEDFHTVRPATGLLFCVINVFVATASITPLPPPPLIRGCGTWGWVLARLSVNWWISASSQSLFMAWCSSAGITYSKGQVSWEAGSCSGGDEIFPVIWNLKFRYRVHKRSYWILPWVLWIHKDDIFLMECYKIRRWRASVVWCLYSFVKYVHQTESCYGGWAWN
jgi:hypothetical protein